MEIHDQAAVARLIRSQRWAALATLKQGAPFASLVAYAPEPDFSGFVLHLSRLAPHTQNLLGDPHARNLVVAGPLSSSRGLRQSADYRKSREKKQIR